MSEYLAVKDMVNNIRHVLVNESFNLFARKNVIDLDHLADTVREANRMAGFTMMNDEFQEQLNILMNIHAAGDAILSAIDDQENIYRHFGDMFKPYGMELKDVSAGDPLPWNTVRYIHPDQPTWVVDRELAKAQRGFEPDMDGDTVSEPVVAQTGVSLLICKPYTFILGSFS